MRLLIVDDNPFVRKLYETRARQYDGVLVDTVASPEQALLRVAAHSSQPYDLIVCDEHLGVRVREGTAFVNTMARLQQPVVLVTNGVPPTETMPGARMKILMRPVSLDDLIASARQLRAMST